MSNAYANGSIDQASARIRLYEAEVDNEPWMRDHIEAMRCRSFEETLTFGINVYDFLIELDELERGEVLSGRAKFDPAVRRQIRELFVSWLKPCGAVEAELRKLEKAGFNVERATDFRKRCAEVQWMLKPAKEAFDHAGFVEARDSAIDDVRARKVEEIA